MAHDSKLKVVHTRKSHIESEERSGGANAKKRASKQEAILRVAAEMFNANGVGAVGFQDIARKMGLGRASLYHYVSDKQDLIFRCFQRACEADTENLDAACEKQPGLPQVLEYMRLSFAPETASTALITDIDVLDAGPKAIIQTARRRNHDRLATMISNGIVAGNIRPCDEVTIARVLPSMIVFTRMSQRWAPTDQSRCDIDALVDFVELGTAVDRNVHFSFYKNASDFSPITLSDFTKRSTADLKIEQILMKASSLINLHGIENVTSDDVAKELGASRGTVYHYFRDRQELIQKCLDRSYKLYDDFIDYAIQHGKNGLEQSAIISHLNTQAQAGSLQPVASWMGVEVLGPEFRERAVERMQRLLKRTQEIALTGIADGSRRDHDSERLNFARAGAYLWIPKWIDEIDTPSPHHLADEVVRLFNSGLRPLE